MAFTVGSITVAPSGSATRQTLVASNTITSTTTGTGNIIGLDAFSIADIQLSVTAASGTTPTLDVYVQKLLPDGVTWDDIIHFTQATAAANYMATMTVGGGGVHTAATRSLAAGTVRANCTFGNTWRVDVVVGGTNPSFTWLLVGDLY
jgi:hypothetical protein